MKPIIFCDFDGTITETDNIFSLMTEFVPQESEKIAKAMMEQTISFKDGLSAMFHLLSTEQKDEVIQYLMDTAVIREGFEDFVRYAQNHDIPFYIVSGGVDFFIEPLVEKYGPFSGIYCNKADFSGEQIKLIYSNSCDEECAKYSTQGCGCCKPSVMRKVAKEEHFKIVIGDSLSDFEAAKQADIVLARDHLIQRCEELHVSYKPFITFHDCLKIVQELMETNHAVPTT
ncbi:MtnX-like HAD-IB family phosphatase [Lysinibacillus sp. fkY74-1]|uniref:2-hydroxy-3-keto-5-methylthiopentenyl-1-phosphate phosphatase n=3 Tax=Lysinibacillus TaxID=400634 RepID=MTNX_LYSSC|nr:MULTISPECIES: MtnX-like HAD-IB family phosphatase [Lysinibacillus]B1HYT5.2 RecName: Full=2-hydroxy-3-keto-5-methylthiopentenyl-1-phosphate phosphatase; Short=HK-MTPenyl-1-P phosphatase [Lysinibacillus sphaericus C3-41]MBE5085450.1 MtnX-like HAD-IB family phosphatase [Bacillus thuringiensis]AMO31898.1 2-hydroxy-3-keto-5-methylthiopentenyl-1-phosphate phosphatase [Lysinibacillus sphaericus]AMR88984.1 2-hydroxy-3-keto-5-methylthiopentenyl-1-phosphate phosphatase [Lysinibacillus sphaericus]ANA4